MHCGTPHSRDTCCEYWSPPQSARGLPSLNYLQDIRQGIFFYFKKSTTQNYNKAINAASQVAKAFAPGEHSMESKQRNNTWWLRGRGRCEKESSTCQCTILPRCVADINKDGIHLLMEYHKEVKIKVRDKVSCGVLERNKSEEGIKCYAGTRGNLFAHWDKSMCVCAADFCTQQSKASKRWNVSIKKLRAEDWLLMLFLVYRLTTTP